LLRLCHLKKLIDLSVLSKVYNECTRNLATPFLMTMGSFVFTVASAVLIKIHKDVFKHPLTAIMPLVWIDSIVVIVGISSLHSLVFTKSSDILQKGFTTISNYTRDKSFRKRVQATMPLKLYMTHSFFDQTLPVVIMDNSICNAISLCLCIDSLYQTLALVLVGFCYKLICVSCRAIKHSRFSICYLMLTKTKDGYMFVWYLQSLLTKNEL